MSVLDRKLGRELRRVRATLVAILLVVVMGVACFVGLTSVYLNLESSRRAYYGQCRMEDFWVSLKKAPLSEIFSLPCSSTLRPRGELTRTLTVPWLPSGSTPPSGGTWR